MQAAIIFQHEPATLAWSHLGSPGENFRVRKVAESVPQNRRLWKIVDSGCTVWLSGQLLEPSSV
jgi:hypothetical protein